MPPIFRLQDILTEPDNSISSEMNLDPLGLQVIWSAYGQQIFRNRISSISNDVRNFTLNLFHHAAIKKLVETPTAVLGRGLRSDGAYGIGGKDSPLFKRACLAYLENIFSLVMVERQHHEGVETEGVIGISKARSVYESKGAGLAIRFSPHSGHLLVRQHLLGVSGRYKTPLISMRFFNGSHDYASPEFRSAWERAELELFQKGSTLARLRDAAYLHLCDLIADARTEPERFLNSQDPKRSVPAKYKTGIVHAFKSAPAVGKLAGSFWLGLSELDRGAAGALGTLLADNGADLPPADIYRLAADAPDLDVTERSKLLDVLKLEPLLAECDLLLQIVLSAKAHHLRDVANSWRAFGRHADTLPALAEPIIQDTGMRTRAGGTARSRLDGLLRIAATPDVMGQITQLIEYHGTIMAARQQPPWVRLLPGDQLRVDVRTRTLPGPGDRPIGQWIHHYYIPQFRSFLSGLEGVA